MRVLRFVVQFCSVVVASQLNTRLHSFLVSNEKNMKKCFDFLCNWGLWYHANILVLVTSTPETWKAESILYKMYKHNYSLNLKIPSFLFKIQLRNRSCGNEETFCFFLFGSPVITPLIRTLFNQIANKEFGLVCSGLLFVYSFRILALFSNECKGTFPVKSWTFWRCRGQLIRLKMKGNNTVASKSG